MKSFKLLSWTAVLSLLLLYSCRTPEELIIPVHAATVAVPEADNSIDGETKDPPKDYDDWRIKTNR